MNWQKYSIGLYAFLLCINASFSQQSVVKGVVTIHNSKYEKGQAEYVDAAAVHVPSGKAVPTATDSQGKFELELVGVEEQTSFQFMVEKLGLEVVNLDKLSAVAGQKEVLRISMSSPEKLSEFRQQIYEVGRTRAEKFLTEKLEETQAALLAAVQQTNIDNEAIDSLQSAYQLLSERYNKVEQQARVLAEKYARINLDEVSPVYQEAFRNFQNGRLEEALEVLRAANLKGEAKKIIQERARIAAIQEDIATRDSIQKSRTEEIMQTLRLEIDILKTQQEFTEIPALFEILLGLDSLNLSNRWSYAYFLSDQKLIQKAIGQYERCLALAVNEIDIVNILQNIGNLYIDINQFEKSEAAFLKIIEIENNAQKTGKKDVLSEALIARVDFGLLYAKHFQFDKADEQLAYALDMLLESEERQLDVPDSDAFHILSSIAAYGIGQNEYEGAEELLLMMLDFIQNNYDAESENDQLQLLAIVENLGLIYRTSNKFEKAIQYQQQHLNIANQLAGQNFKQYGIQLGKAYHNWGALQSRMGNVSSADSSYQRALETYTLLSEESSGGIYDYELALTLNNYGTMWMRANNYEKALAWLSNALELFTSLEKINPERVAPFRAQNQMSIASVYQNLGEYEKALPLQTELLDYFLKQSAVYPKRFNTSLAMIHNGIGLSYLNMGEIAKAELAFKESEKLFEALIKGNPEKFEPEYATVNYNLGLIYNNTNRLDDAEACLMKALNTRKKLALSAPDAYKLPVAETSTLLGVVYTKKQYYSEALKIQMEVFQPLESSAKEHPEVYEPTFIQLLDNLALTYQGLRQYKESEQSLLRLIKIHERNRTSRPALFIPMEASLYGRLGDLYGLMNDRSASESAYLKAVEIFRALPKSPEIQSQIAYTLNNLGHNKFRSSIFDEAEQYYLEALTILEKLVVQKPHQFKPLLTATYNFLANTYVEIDAEEKATIYYRKAIQCFYDILAAVPPQYQGEKARIYNDIGYSSFSAGAYAEAITAHESAIAIYSKLYEENPERFKTLLAISYGNLSWALLFEQDYKKAEKAANEGLKFDPGQSWINVNLCSSLLLQGKTKAAAKIGKAYKGKTINVNNDLFEDALASDLKMLRDKGITSEHIEELFGMLGIQW